MAIAPDTLVTPAMWQGDKAPMRARFVVRMTWKEKDTASIEIFSPASAKDPVGFRKSRDLAFFPQDSENERGRAMGLVVAELLRESPASPLVVAKPDHGKAAPESGSPPRLALGGMLAGERVRSGDWAMGPDLTYDFMLGEAIRLRASGEAIFGSADQYSGIGADVGVFWDFLRSEHGRHALGVGFVFGALRESATAESDHDRSASKWSLELGPSLVGRVAVWRTLRIVGEADLRVTSGAMTVTPDNGNGAQLSFSRWRPFFALGLEFAL